MTALTAVLGLFEPSGKYPHAIERLIAVLERLTSVDANLVVVDNAREGDWEHPVSRSLMQIGGDNRAREFSAFDKGLAVSERWQPATEVVALVTDAFEAYGNEYLELIDDQLIRSVVQLEACVGWMDSFGFEECRIGDLSYDTWMRSSFLLIPRERVGLVSPLAADLGSEGLFGSGPERPFADGGLLSENLKERLLEWLTARSAGPGQLSEHWHSRFELSAENFPFFQSKVRAILREHLISARLKQAGVACYDFRCLRRLADEGRLEAFLDQGGQADLQWLGWRLPRHDRGSQPSGENPAAESPAAEAETLDAVPAAPDLPEIHHYWSNTYLRPKLRQFGFDSPDDFFRLYTEKLCRAAPGRRLRFISIGGGNQEFEVELARQLVARGISNFSLQGTGASPAMIERARHSAELAGVAGHLGFSSSGFDRRPPVAACDAVLANQCLHEVVELEELFGTIRASLAADGYFLAHDNIGRNDRTRWPEAQQLIERLWAQLPERYRYNHRQQRLETGFEDHRRTPAGPHRGRSQEILPLLLERFHFELFFGFANLIGPFTGRSFGHNFDPEAEDDRAFIDRVQAEDDQALRAGRIKPTRMLAAMTVSDTGIHLCDGEMTAPFAVRPPDAG